MRGLSVKILMARRMVGESQWCDTMSVCWYRERAKQKLLEGKDFFLKNGSAEEFSTFLVLEEQTASSTNLYYRLILCRFAVAIQAVYSSSSQKTAAYNISALWLSLLLLSNTGKSISPTSLC